MLEEKMSALREKKRNTCPYFCLVRPSSPSLACQVFAPLSSGCTLFGW